MKKILTLLLVLVLCVSVFAACKKEEPQPEQPTYDVAAAAEYVEGLYKEELGTTAADFNVVPQVRVAGATYTITWTVDTDKVTVEVSEDGKTVTVNVPEKSDEDFSYSLTATVKAPDGTTASTSFTCNVIKYAVNSHADYMAAQKDDELTIEGIVVAINSVSMGNKYNHLFLADAEVDGGYYCYKLSADPAELGIKVGMTVSITSKASPYNGMQELFGGTPVIVDETIKTVDVLDITDAFTAKSNLGAYVGLPVTIKGVTLGEQALEKDTDQYLWFAIGDAKGYVRTYVTDFPAGMLAADDKAAIDADHKDHFGWKADVTGILILYSGQPYLIPMSVTPFTNYEEQIKTPEEKVAAELAGVKLDASLSSDKVIDLLLAGQYYDDVVLTWTTTDETGAAVIADGKLTLTVPDEAITVSITVTATCGEVSDSKTLTVKLSKSITSIADALVVAGGQEHNTYTTEKYILGGIIVEIQNATYGNMVIKDENGDSILIYGVYINGAKYGEAEGDKPVVGDYIVVIGGLGRYNDTKQMKNGDLMSFVAASSIKDAADAGAAQEHDTYTENKFLVTGVIESIANAKYGNMTIKDADGNSIYVYGVYNQVGVRYDSLTTLPAIGDTVTLLGVAGRYNDTVQLKNATLVAHTAATVEPPVEECEHNYVNGVCTKCEAVDPDYNAGGSTTPEQPESGVVSAPVAGTAYKFGMVQSNLNDGKVYYLKGGMDGFYMATTTDVAQAIDVYLEVAGEGFYLYTLSGETKTYINMVVSGTHVNGAYEATASTVYRFDATSKTLIADVNGTDYWFGTRNDKNYTTVGPCAVSYKGFICQFYGETAGEDNPPAHEHEFVNGECACGEKDPNYVAPECEHNYVDGVCTKCEAVDPDYVAPHEHEFVNGECACGEKDPNYVPPVVEKNVITIPEALAIATAQGDTYTTEKYYITGIVKNISNTFYGNFYLVDAEGNELYVYGLKDATGQGNFSGLDPQPAVGDTLTIYTVLGCYYGSPQAKDAWFDSLVQHTEHDWTEATCKAAKTCTVCGKVEGEPLEHVYVDGSCTGCGKDEPVQGTVVTTTEPFAGLTASGSYKTVTTTSGWTAVNAAVLTGGTKDQNPVFQFIGATADSVAICLNGKTAAVGKLTSATLQGGISKLSFSYGNAFSESKGVDITINILQNGAVVATTTLDNDSVSQKTAYDFVWELDNVVNGEFVIEIVNNSPSNNASSNKDRVAIFNFSWDSAPVAAA